VALADPQVDARSTGRLPAERRLTDHVAFRDLVVVDVLRRAEAETAVVQLLRRHLERGTANVGDVDRGRAERGHERDGLAFAERGSHRWVDRDEDIGRVPCVYARGRVT